MQTPLDFASLMTQTVDLLTRDHVVCAAITWEPSGKVSAITTIDAEQEAYNCVSSVEDMLCWMDPFYLYDEANPRSAY